MSDWHSMGRRAQEKVAEESAARERARELLDELMDPATESDLSAMFALDAEQVLAVIWEAEGLHEGIGDDLARCERVLDVLMWRCVSSVGIAPAAPIHDACAAERAQDLVDRGMALHQALAAVLALDAGEAAALLPAVEDEANICRSVLGRVERALMVLLGRLRKAA